MNCIAINNQQLPVMEWQGQRVVTFKDIDRVHERPMGTAIRNFKSNRKHFIKDTDYFEMTKKDFGTKFVPNSKSSRGNPNVNIFLFTETGYLMIVKSFTDDLAWDVQRKLVTSYFKLKELSEAAAQPNQELLKLDDDIQSQITAIAAKVARETVEQTLSESIVSPMTTTVQYIESSSKTIIDPIRDTIKPLAELYGDASNGYNCTFRKVYDAMACDWKNRRSRYKNRKGNKNAPSNITLIEQDAKLLKLFVGTVQRLMSECQVSNV